MKYIFQNLEQIFQTMKYLFQTMKYKNTVLSGNFFGWFALLFRQGK